MAAEKASITRPDPIEQVFRSYEHDPRDYESILAFLAKHHGVVSALLHARPYLERIFSPERMVLDLVVEPDDEELWEELFCVVERDWNPETALRLLDQFDQEWWSAGMGDDVRMLLNFDVGFDEHAAV